MIEIKRYDGVVLRVVDAQSLRRADLRGANLSGADLHGANLFWANLSWANLSGADLHGANLSWANLFGAHLFGANLSGADLHGANLFWANLSGAHLSGADLYGADLYGANLSGANLENAKLPHFRILPERGSFLAYKALSNGLALVRIPRDAARTNALGGRKCRAERVVVVGLKLTDGSGVGIGIHDGTKYIKGATVVADRYNPDIRVECTHGIHFFMTKQEAVDYGK